MTIYEHILAWSQNRPDFIKDALRRIIANTSITQNDIAELVALLKKENGLTAVTLNAIPITALHIPVAVNSGAVYPKLNSIKNPVNICALYDQGHLEFSPEGLNVVYGSNGSGKSSYSRILKRLCWSRNPGVQLKKNVFNPSNLQQQVNFKINVNGVTSDFDWIENHPSHPLLSSVYVFDNECANVYVSSENPTEYKPVGIDVLERLIAVLISISESLTQEVSAYTSPKPKLDPPLDPTITGQWYANFEIRSREEVDAFIQYSPSDSQRKQEVFTLISSQNPQQAIGDLNNMKLRFESYFQQFNTLETYFSEQHLQELRDLKERHITIKTSYNIAITELNGLNTLNGFGSDPWRQLWEAAKNFATSNGMVEGQIFPSAGSLEKCVLCQQELDIAAQERLKGFNQFILNDISTQLDAVQNAIHQKVSLFQSLTVPPHENFIELDQYIANFQNEHINFTNHIAHLKANVLHFLQNETDLSAPLSKISGFVSALFPNIETQLEQQKQVLLDRNPLIREYNELCAKEFLWINKPAVLQYHDEVKYKNWITTCQAQLNTSSVSRKIGELMEDQAVNLQHVEFINHLNSFNPALADKVLLSKTRTTQGNTFQRCSLNGIPDSINSVLSEGEQKVIALSNFLAECTIDSRKNTIIFDDPVTSLDMAYRDVIAKKIVELSSDRQIVVLTHDLSFLRLLLDTHNDILSSQCHIIGIDNYDGISGIVTDEIPYLARNVQERIDSIRRILSEHDALPLTSGHDRETKLDAARKRFRMLLERSVEEILANKTYERFSKNIHLKKGYLSGYIVTNQSDVDFLLDLFGKYSVTEHDGGVTTIPQLPSKTLIEQHISEYSAWKDGFKAKLKTFVAAYN